MLSEFLSAYYPCANANSSSFLQNSPSLPKDSVSSPSETVFSKQHSARFLVRGGTQLRRPKVLKPSGLRIQPLISAAQGLGHPSQGRLGGPERLLKATERLQEVLPHLHFQQLANQRPLSRVFLTWGTRGLPRIPVVFVISVVSVISLSGPVSRNAARLYQRNPLSHAMGFLVSQHGQLGAMLST